MLPSFFFLFCVICILGSPLPPLRPPNLGGIKFLQFGWNLKPLDLKFHSLFLIFSHTKQEVWNLKPWVSSSIPFLANQTGLKVLCCWCLLWLFVLHFRGSLEVKQVCRLVLGYLAKVCDAPWDPIIKFLSSLDGKEGNKESTLPVGRNVFV